MMVDELLGVGQELLARLPAGADGCRDLLARRGRLIASLDPGRVDPQQARALLEQDARLVQEAARRTDELGRSVASLAVLRVRPQRRASRFIDRRT